jgi:hypothetical protein
MQKLNAWQSRRLNRRQSKLRRKHKVKKMKRARMMMKMDHQIMKMKKTVMMTPHQTEPTSNQNQGKREAAELRWNTVLKAQNQHLEPTMNSK